MTTATAMPTMSPVGVPPPLSLSGASAPTSTGSGDDVGAGADGVLPLGVAIGRGVARLFGPVASLSSPLAPGPAVDTPVVDCGPRPLSPDFAVVVPLSLLPGGED